MSEYNTAKSPAQADALALRSDWLAVGDAMRLAIRTFEAEHVSELAGLDKPSGLPAETTRAAACAAAPPYSGPIPPPDALAQYEKVMPGAADRILTLAERELAYQQKVEMDAISSDARLGMAWLGLWGVIALAGLALAGALTVLGQPAFGFAAAMLAIATFTGALAYEMRWRCDVGERRRQSFPVSTGPGNPGHGSANA